jgi:acyltransferase
MDDMVMTGPASSQRIGWIDTLKGIGIFLVFLGHLLTYSQEGIVRYIFSFHMPLFFFISGFFFKHSDAGGGSLKFIMKTVRLRMVPYVSFGILTYCIWVSHIILIKNGKLQSLAPLPESLFIKPVIGMLYGNGIHGWLTHNVLLWFLACLMITELFFYGISAIADNKTLKIAVILVVFAILGHMDSRYSSIRLPFSMDVALTAVVFYGSGHILKGKLLASKITPLFSAPCLAIGLLTAHLNGNVDMNLNRYGNIFLFYISSFSSIYGYMYLSRRLYNVKFLSCIGYVGRNSLVFFLLQGPAFIFTSFLVYTALRIKVNPNELTFLRGSAYVLLSMILIAPVSFIIYNYTPFMIGGKTIKQKH